MSGLKDVHQMWKAQPSLELLSRQGPHHFSPTRHHTPHQYQYRWTVQATESGSGHCKTRNRKAHYRPSIRNRRIRLGNGKLKTDISSQAYLTLESTMDSSDGWGYYQPKQRQFHRPKLPEDGLRGPKFPGGILTPIVMPPARPT